MIIQHLRVAVALLARRALCRLRRRRARRRTALQPRGRRSCSSRSTRRAPTRLDRSVGRRDAGVQRRCRARAPFRQAYATAPETLPSHSSMMTGLYPAGHGVHENGRSLAAAAPARRRAASQARAIAPARSSPSFVLARRFGLARGFDVYDDELAGRRRRAHRRRDDDRRALAYRRRRRQRSRSSSGSTTSSRMRRTRRRSRSDRDSRRSRTSAKSRRWIEQLGRLVQAFEQRVAARGGATAIVIAGDHGEGLGDHGESQHGNLLYQSTMHVPLVLAGPGVAAGVSDDCRSARAGSFTRLLDWAGLDAAHSLRGDGGGEVVLGEAMKPFLEYGWQPQIMAVDRPQKAIFAGTTEVYDLVADPGETKTSVRAPTCRQRCGRRWTTIRAVARAGARAGQPVGRSAAKPRQPRLRQRERAAGRPQGRAAAGRHGRHSSTSSSRRRRCSSQARYAEAIPLLEKILAADPYNLDAALRLATAHSSLGQDAKARRRRSSAPPRSRRARRTCGLYLALHYARGTRLGARGPAPRADRRRDARSPAGASRRWPSIREKQGRIEDAMALRQRIMALRTPAAADLVRARPAGDGRRSRRRWRSSPSRRRAALDPGARFSERPRAGRALPCRAPLRRRARRARSRPAVASRLPDGALQARAGQRAAEGARQRRADRARARRGADATTRELIANERRLFQELTGRS